MFLLKKQLNLRTNPEKHIKKFRINFSTNSAMLTPNMVANLAQIQEI